MIVAYVWFTIKTSNWRIGIRREMNASDTDANSKAIDSLLNFETVKYFGNETMESARFDESMARYEAAATKNLDIARLAQSRPIGHSRYWYGGLHDPVGTGGHGRNADHRRIRADQRPPYAAFHPFEFHRIFCIGKIRQGLADIEAMFFAAQCSCRDPGQAWSKAAQGRRRTDHLQQCQIFTTTRIVQS